MAKPIYYYELDLVINFAKSSRFKRTWYISQVTKDSLQKHLESDRGAFSDLVYIAFKKRESFFKSSKLKSFNINIRSVKQVGHSNN